MGENHYLPTTTKVQPELLDTRDIEEEKAAR